MIMLHEACFISGRIVASNIVQGLIDAIFPRKGCKVRICLTAFAILHEDSICAILRRFV